MPYDGPSDDDVAAFQRLLFGSRSEPPVLHMEGLPVLAEAVSVPALLQDVSHWLKKSGETAEQYAKRVERLLDSNTGPADLAQMLEVLNHLTALFDAAQDMAHELTTLGEAKKSSEALASLSRWLKGASPAVGSYVKKIVAGTVDGRKFQSKDEQEALTHVIAALGAMKSAIDSLNSNLPILVNALGS